MPGARLAGRGGYRRVTAAAPPSVPTGPINGLVFGDSLASGIASRIAALRPGDLAWNEVSQANFGLNDTWGSPAGSGAIGTGSNSFKVKGHDAFYVPGVRNVVVLLSITHRDVQDLRDGDSTIMARLKTLIDEILALGWEVLVCCVPATTEYNDPVGSPYTRPNRIAHNDALRNGGLGQPIRCGANYFADLDAISGLGQAEVGTSGLGAPMLADGIHFSNQGKDAVAPVISTQIPF